MTTGTCARGHALAHEIIGPPDAPVILALGGISATRHVTENASQGWWPGVAGEGKALDTARFRVLGVDYLDGGRQPDGRPARTVTTREQADAIVSLLAELNVDRLHALVGASYGGMVALALAEAHPERVRTLVAISAAHEPHPMSIGLRAIQRRIVELGLETGRAEETMTLARALAMTTYRTSREFGERFDVRHAESGQDVEFAVERYLVEAGRKFATRMSPERFLALSLSVDLHHVTPESIHVPTAVIAAEGDTLVPHDQLESMCARLPRLHGFHTLQTRCGHDAFLTEPTQLGHLLFTCITNELS